MDIGVHLPQFGRAAGPQAIAQAAKQAQDLGFCDVWVSDHLAVPAGVPYPPAYLFEPVITLTWAAAAADEIGLGTSVLIAPNRHPVHLAKELSTLDQLSGGRVKIGLGAGWLLEEFATLGVPAAQRGARTDECIDALRACWYGEDPVNFSGPRITIENMRIRPKPAHDIPLWVGGASEAALQRAVSKGDGWHGMGTPEELEPILTRLRTERPEDSFTLSIRTDWDGQSGGDETVQKQAEQYALLGVQHLVVVPTNPDLDGWLGSVENLWRLLSPFS
jgi:probable F420-dependent oxidoreductase